MKLKGLKKEIKAMIDRIDDFDFLIAVYYFVHSKIDRSTK